MAQRLKTDWILFSTVLAMVVFGVLVVYSASSIMAFQRYRSAWHFVERQAVWAALGLCVMMMLKKLHYRRLQTPAVALSAISVTLLLLATDHIADAPNRRWLRLGGRVGIQPSELAK